MSRPKAGYSIERKIKSAKKSITHLKYLAGNEKNEELQSKIIQRIDFWEKYIAAKTPKKETRTKK